jgi:PhnB protein
MGDPAIETSIAPWLAVADGARAVAFYRDALGAEERYRLDGEGGTVSVAQLQVGGATFWVQEDPEGAPESGGSRPIRIILTVDDPDGTYERAVAAGATPVAPVGEAHGWRTGRVTDPFGHDWELSKPVPS